VGDQLVDLDLLVHVPVDELGHVGAAARPAERGALPDPAGDELERPRRDLLARARDADDHADAPAAVAALERLAHQGDVADALEAVIGAAAGELDEVGHPEAAADRLARGVDVDADDLVGADQARALDHVEPDAAEAEHDDVRAGLDLGGPQHRADAGGHAAAEVADRRERRVLADLGERDL